MTGAREFVGRRDADDAGAENQYLHAAKTVPGASRGSHGTPPRRENGFVMRGAASFVVAAILHAAPIEETGS
jgi:hypothetical protein